MLRSHFFRTIHQVNVQVNVQVSSYNVLLKNHPFWFLVRLASTHAGQLRDGRLNPGSVEEARAWLLTSAHADIPRDQFQISYSRASGPGGQKVNKTSSKATVSLGPSQWLGDSCRSWMPDAVRLQLQNGSFRYQTKAGGLLIQSDTWRNQNDNLDECFRKLLAEIKACVHFSADVQDVHKAKWRRLAAKADSQRLSEKKRHGEKKRARKKAFDL